MLQQCDLDNDDGAGSKVQEEQEQEQEEDFRRFGRLWWELIFFAAL